MSCTAHRSFVESCLDAYIDGELDDRECGELEEHLVQCPTCRHKVREQARLKSLVRDCASKTCAPAHLLKRITAQLDLEDLALEYEENENLQDNVESTSEERLIPSPVSGEALAAFVPKSIQPGWRSMPVFASATFVLAFVWMSAGGFTGDPIIDDAVRKHSSSLPFEITGPIESMQTWLMDKVDFNPELPIFSSSLHPIGARLSHVRDHTAVYVGYGKPGSGPDGERQVSLFVFCAPSLDIMSARHQHRRLGERDVLVTSRNGFNVVLWKENEVVYSLVSRLDERELLQLIGSSGFK